MSWSEQILAELRSEFADLPDAAGVTRLLERIGLAVLLGGLLGYERECKGKAAGLRTHMLVALGTALFVLVPQASGAASADISRVIQGLCAGIGFLGAGAIIKHKSEQHIEGLTTAASVWLTAAVGVAVGLGREATAVTCTAGALLVLWLVPHVGRLAGGGRESDAT